MDEKAERLRYLWEELKKRDLKSDASREIHHTVFSLLFLLSNDPMNAKFPAPTQFKPRVKDTLEEMTEEARKKICQELFKDDIQEMMEEWGDFEETTSEEEEEEGDEHDERETNDEEANAKRTATTTTMSIETERQPPPTP